MDTTRETSPTAAPSPSLQPHRGTCHCGAVQFQVDLDLSSGLTRCNCTICTKIAASGTCVKPEAFALLAGEENLSLYVWGSVSSRFFCRTCGIHVFSRGHLAELGGDFVGVNGNCLDNIDVGQLKIGYWDGRHDNWQAGTRPAPWPLFEAGGVRAAG